MSKKLALEKLYTSRWFVTNAINTLEDEGNTTVGLASMNEAQKELTRAIDYAKAKEPVTSVDDEEPDRPDAGAVGQKLLVCPFADQSIRHVTRGKFRKGYPEGIIIHFTSGNCDTEGQARGTMEYGKKQGYAYWGLGPTGIVYQSHSLNSWGHHAGQSSHPKLGSSVSKYLLGLEVVCAGKVDANGKAWFGTTYSKDRLRMGPAKDNCAAGTYVKFTDKQEDMIINLILWLKRNNPEVFDLDLILGHDSVSPGRKTDPGWSLSMTIPELREKVKELYRA